MGKNLKNKECGKGINQRKDGKFSARYYSQSGKRQEKYFDTLPEARNWLADAKYEDKHGMIVATPDMTVDTWFDFRIKNLICDLTPNTLRNYQERYKHNVQPIMGKMCISDVKPMHCKAVLNRMEEVKFLTVEEQTQFLETAKRSHNHRQYALLLETRLLARWFAQNRKELSYKLCDEAGMKRFCMHALRHTYATCAIDGRMQPKVLQKLLGHASIKTTMDHYVHVTDDSMANAVRQFESAYAIIE